MSRGADGEGDFGDRFWERICSYRNRLYHLLVLDIVLFLLVGFSFAFIEPGSASYVVLQFDVIILTVVLVPTLACLYLCRGYD